MENIFFKNWDGVLRILIMAPLAYVYLVFILRISGKRTLSKMNAFDFVITVAFGSSFAAIILTKDIVLAEGATALTMLAFLQHAVTWLSVRSKTVSDLVKSEPRFLYYGDKFLSKVLKEEQVNKDEVLAAVRSSGLEDLARVEAVILETDGTFSVIQKKEEKTGTSAFEGVKKE